ncbi:MAG: amidohydrolase family protein [Pseudomonadales bacterium]|jgi:imidazolonepropionase-like amidohydrolase|nr:amidohydrolase [Acidiferrobacteraceae bacterium]MDP6375431.1 amidohydrolase family protein [Pseudomonadales bacterium]MDP6470663.1 amidohydrolase family protein [Pseudomonadales bacterium]MDP6828480.1 amidohydrolase family protein [Pseudomonadales bacterium]MDP6970534.1 amidohydrolase family protein [Pseudomonadales bacterium]
MRRLTAILLALAMSPCLWAGDLAVRGETLYTMAGEPIRDGVVLIRDGRIRKVGPASRVHIPDGVTTLEAKVVTPGLVDAHSTVGLSGVYGARAGQVHDQDQLEKTEPVQPMLRPVDAYNASDPLIEWVRQFGVTTLHTGHGPGAVISGQTMIVKPRGRTPEDALVEEATAIAITLGPSVSANYETPGTRAKSVAMLRTALVEAQAYRTKRDDDDKPAGRDLKHESLLRLLDGELKAMITAHRVTDIAAALRLKEEFDLDLILDGASEAYLLTDELLEAAVPVLLHPPMMRAARETENATIESGRLLAEAGVPFAIQTGFESYVPKTRILLFEAAIAAAHGLGLERALEAVTIAPARILEVDHRVGSLEKGKDGDLVLFDGDPFEYTSHACTVVIEGEVVSEECW